MSFPYNSYEEFYYNSNHKLATLAGSVYLEHLKTGNEIEQRIYSDRVIQVATVEDGLEKALDGNVAFLWTEPTVNLLVGQNCSHSKIPQCFYTSMNGWAVRKDFAYTGFINNWYLCCISHRSSEMAPKILPLLFQFQKDEGNWSAV